MDLEVDFKVRKDPSILRQQALTWIFTQKEEIFLKIQMVYGVIPFLKRSKKYLGELLPTRVDRGGAHSDTQRLPGSVVDNPNG